MMFSVHLYICYDILVVAGEYSNWEVVGGETVP